MIKIGKSNKHNQAKAMTFILLHFYAFILIVFFKILLSQFYCIS